MTKHLFIFGYGYSAEAIARTTRDRFASIHGTSRSAEKAEALAGSGIKPLVFDGVTVTEDMAQPLAQATHLIVSIAPNDNGDPVLNAAADLLRASGNLEWIGYLSTVGVYGDHGGGWVNEETECRPVSKRSLERVAAEKAWRQLAEDTGLKLAIFRLSGIYGPGRNGFVNIEKGKARRLVKPGQVFNRIHRDDIGRAVALAISGGHDGIFNITDDMPAPPQDVVTYAHQLAGKEPPPKIDFETADLTPMARSFYGENKRVCNVKSKQVLGMKYDWPDFRVSLKRMWREGSWRSKGR